ncbi:MAG TPA: DUF4136 domain-containing protein [Alphaproteobacteria bacterium]|nr:DUF4136 domain-containing protein [Alphaproteobacteria bacterium]
MKTMLKLVGAGLFAMFLAGCTTTVVSDVTTFGHANVPPGSTVQVVAKDPKKAGTLEFKTYANMVGSALGAHGFKPTPSGAKPDYIAQVDYSVDSGKVMVRSSPGYIGGYYGRPWGWGPYPYWGWGYYDPFYDPFYGPYGGNDIDSYVVYRRTLHVAIVNTANNQQVFEANVESRGTNNHLNEVMPYMVQALFSRYPGDNGKTIRVKTKIPND